jgi:HPt (histidine-containing phosphotransfer) domain-containing protein
MRPEEPDRAPTAPADERAGHEALARLRRFGGDALVRDMWALFAADAPGRVAAARAGAASGDAAAVRLAAHSLRSSCAQLGAAHAAALGEAAERLARRGDLGSVPAILDRLEAALAAFARWIDGEVGASTAGRAAPQERA